MSEEKKTLGRRGFLKGATLAGVAAAVSGSGVFGQERMKMKAPGEIRKPYIRGDVKEEAGVKEDTDVVPLANDLLKSSVESALDSYYAAAETIVKGKDEQISTQNLLEQHGLRFESKESKATIKTLKVPASILKIREEQLKQKGWHSHAYSVDCCCWGSICWDVHWHVSW
ncbi:MAG TPA: twin-arginine translocation signal domain-containing protein [Candidatus Deferrimicrobium sp.]|nr:twin-arginine translocation signal domain-containing protein [Candidatus Deferrimicrobium sp.]